MIPCTLYLPTSPDLAALQAAWPDWTLSAEGEIVVGRQDTRAFHSRQMPAAALPGHLDALRQVAEAGAGGAPPALDATVTARSLVILEAPDRATAWADRHGLVLALLQQQGGVAFFEGMLLDAAALQGRADLSAPIENKRPDFIFKQNPPRAARVADRARVLAAVVQRGFVEAEDGTDADRQALVDWLSREGLAPELEPGEAALLSSPVGSLDEQDAIDATWRVEGLATLAWALHLTANLPPAEGLARPADLLALVGLLMEAPPGLAAPVLRPTATLLELDAALEQARWVQRERGGPDWARDPAAGALAERHRGLRWLLGQHRIYAAVDPAL